MDVHVLLVSIRSTSSDTEIVLARNLQWSRLIKVPNMQETDELIVATSNGGSVSLPFSIMEERAYDGQEFDANITGVPLASSLRIRIEPSELGDSAGSAVYRSRKSSKGSVRLAKSSGGFLISLFSDKESFLLVLLSSLIVAVIAITSQSLLFNQDALLLSTISILLALLTTSQVLKKYMKAEETGVSYNLYLVGHTFTSPDAPVNQPEDEIPKRFINGCDGDLREARRRWEITREWREKEGADGVTAEVQQHFDIIKANYPFYWCGRGKKEGHLVFYERPGELDRKVLIEQTGLTVVEMLRHWLYVTEYQWKYLAPDEMAKTISVVDMGAVSYGSLSGEPYKFLNASIKVANAHYPERSYVIFIVNAPGWFSMLWKIIKGFISPLMRTVRAWFY